MDDDTPWDESPAHGAAAFPSPIYTSTSGYGSVLYGLQVLQRQQLLEYGYAVALKSVLLRI